MICCFFLWSETNQQFYQVFKQAPLVQLRNNNLLKILAGYRWVIFFLGIFLLWEKFQLLFSIQVAPIPPFRMDLPLIWLLEENHHQQIYQNLKSGFSVCSILSKVRWKQFYRFWYQQDCFYRIGTKYFFHFFSFVLRPIRFPSDDSQTLLCFPPSFLHSVYAGLHCQVDLDSKSWIFLWGLGFRFHWWTYFLLRIDWSSFVREGFVFRGFDRTFDSLLLQENDKYYFSVIHRWIKNYPLHPNSLTDAAQNKKLCHIF